MGKIQGDPDNYINLVEAVFCGSGGVGFIAGDDQFGDVQEEEPFGEHILRDIACVTVRSGECGEYGFEAGDFVAFVAERGEDSIQTEGRVFVNDGLELDGDSMQFAEIFGELEFGLGVEGERIRGDIGDIEESVGVWGRKAGEPVAFSEGDFSEGIVTHDSSNFGFIGQNYKLR